MSEAAITGKAATQERILVAATALFLEQGYERTTVQQVADRAGVSRATVFWHFSEKAALFRESFSRLFQPFLESLERDLSDLDPAKRLDEHIAASDRFTREHREEIAAFVRWAVESETFREHVIGALLDLNQRFERVIIETVEALAPRGGDAKLLASGIVLAFDARLLISLFDSSSRRTEEHGAAVAELARLVHGLSSRPDGS